MHTPWSIAEGNELADAIQTFAKFIKARPDNIAFVGSCSYAISVAAKNILQQRLRPTEKTASGIRKKVLVLHNQMSSNVYPWQDLRSEVPGLEIVAPVRNHTLSEADSTQKGNFTGWTETIVNFLKEHDDIVIAALPNVHWCDGEVIDLVEIGKLCRQKDIGAF